MPNDPQKTIPYTQSPAELETLRLMRKTAKFFGDLEKAGEEAAAPQGSDNSNSDPESGTTTTPISDRG